MDTTYPIRCRFFKLQSMKKFGSNSLTDICKKNNYYHTQHFDTVQLIHTILRYEYLSEYDDFINFNEIKKSEYNDREIELYNMKIVELKIVLKSYKLTQNGPKLFLVKRILKYEFYNKIVTYEEQKLEEAKMLVLNLGYLPELNYFNWDYSEKYHKTYDISKMYSPLDFYNIEDYALHLENLRILNKFDLINSHLESLENNWFRLVKYSLIELGWEFENENEDFDYNTIIEDIVNEKYKKKEENNSIINNIKEFTYKNTDKCDCMICMENIEENDICKKLNCNHIFHSKCINSWLERTLECPLCRNNIT